jgi:hypothetical protein
MKLVVVLTWLSLVLAGVAHATTARSGLYGVVVRGPISPMCVAEQPCTKPAVGAVLVFSRAGHEVARTTVGSGGAYRIRLESGPYAVRTLHRRVEPATVRVRSRMRREDFSIDTGIR